MVFAGRARRGGGRLRGCAADGGRAEACACSRRRRRAGRGGLSGMRIRAGLREGFRSDAELGEIHCGRDRGNGYWKEKPFWGDWWG